MKSNTMVYLVIHPNKVKNKIKNKIKNKNVGTLRMMYTTSGVLDKYFTGFFYNIM